MNFSNYFLPIYKITDCKILYRKTEVLELKQGGRFRDYFSEKKRKFVCFIQLSKIPRKGFLLNPGFLLKYIFYRHAHLFQSGHLFTRVSENLRPLLFFCKPLLYSPYSLKFWECLIWLNERFLSSERRIYYWNIFFIKNH